MTKYFRYFIFLSEISITVVTSHHYMYKVDFLHHQNQLQSGILFVCGFKTFPLKGALIFLACCAHTFQNKGFEYNEICFDAVLFVCVIHYLLCIISRGSHVMHSQDHHKRETLYCAR